MFNDRQRQIIDLLTNEGEIRITDLKDQFNVTEMTLRRDLEKLEKQGILRRTFGGAIMASKDISLRDRAVHHIVAKKRIGRAAASMIQQGESIYLDGGTTTLQVARHLKPDKQITVVTNALNIAVELLERNIQFMMVGGIVIDKTASMVGPLAVEALQKMAFDRIFLGATGVSVEHGFSNSNPYEADLKRLAIHQAAHVHIVLDHSKFGERSLVSFADLQDVDQIVTDMAPSDAFKDICMEKQVDIIIG